MDLCVYEVALNGHVSLNGGQYNNARMQLHGLVCESKLVPYGGRHMVYLSLQTCPSALKAG